MSTGFPMSEARRVFTFHHRCVRFAQLACESMLWPVRVACACLLLTEPLLAQSPPPVAGIVSRKIVQGDRLDVVVLKDESLSKVYPVMGDGTIEMAYAGRIYVANKTPESAAEVIERHLEADYFLDAQVRVNFSEFVQGAVVVMGAVNSPQRLEYRSEQMLTLMDALVAAGWLAQNANGREVKILRWSTEGGMHRDVVTVDVQAMWDAYDFKNDHYLQPRDVVVVPATGTSEEAMEFLVLGEVGNIGFHPWRENLDLIRAITGVGGFTREARLDSVRILRPDPAGQVSVIPVDMSVLFSGNMKENRQILAGDIIFVPSAASANAGQVHLLGEVNNPGSYDLPLNKSMTLSRLLLVRGGAKELANLRKVRVIRTGPDGTKQTLVHDVKEILDNGLFEQDVPLQDQDVIIVPSRTLGF